MSLKTLNKKKESRKREDAIASDFNGRRVVASGALWNKKGDAKTDLFLFEDKFTSTTDSYNVTLMTLNKIYKQAQFHRRIPIFRFGKLGKDGYIVVSEFFLIENISEFSTYYSEEFYGKKSLKFKFLELDEIFSSYDIAKVSMGDEIKYKYYMFPYRFFEKNWQDIIVS